jgi:hypothetical protein
MRPSWARGSNRGQTSAASGGYQPPVTTHRTAKKQTAAETALSLENSQAVGNSVF